LCSSSFCQGVKVVVVVVEKDTHFFFFFRARDFLLHSFLQTAVVVVSYGVRRIIFIFCSNSTLLSRETATTA